MAKKTYFLPPPEPPMSDIEWDNSMTDDFRAMLADATRRVLEHTKGPPPMTEAQKQLDRGLKWAARLGDVDPPEDGMMPTDGAGAGLRRPAGRRECGGGTRRRGGVEVRHGRGVGEPGHATDGDGELPQHAGGMASVGR